MKQIKRTEITIETHSLSIVRIKQAETATVFCAFCRRDVQPLTPLQAVLIFRVSEHLLAELAGQGQIHTAGKNAFCPVSLAGFFKHEIRFMED